jgi:hypothetical protein
MLWYFRLEVLWSLQSRRALNLNKRDYVQIPAARCNRATPAPSYAWDEQRWAEEIARKCSYETSEPTSGMKWCQQLVHERS